MVLFFGFGVFGLGVGVLNKYKIVFIIIVKFLNYFLVLFIIRYCYKFLLCFLNINFLLIFWIFFFF